MHPFARALVVAHLCLLIAPGRAAAADGVAEEEVRRVLAGFMTAAREGGNAKALAYYSRRVHIFTPGGAKLGYGFISRNPGSSWKTRAMLVRHVDLIKDDVAVAVGLWRETELKPPYDAGTFDYVLVREDGQWKIIMARNSFLPSPSSFALPAETAQVSGDGIVTDAERAAGWLPLFDGKTNRGWFSMTGSRELPPAWRIEDGCLVTVSGQTAMALRTHREYRSFEMTFEWSTSKNGNSGVKYRVFGVELFARGLGGDATGFEYQVADDDGDPGARVDPKQKSGALYGVTAVAKPAAKAPGEWNLSRIVVNDDHVEHWLNGVETARYPVDVPFASPIVLQHHSSEMRFRHLKIRPMEARREP